MTYLLAAFMPAQWDFASGLPHVLHNACRLAEDMDKALEEHAQLSHQLATAESSCSEAQHRLQQLEETLQQVLILISSVQWLCHALHARVLLPGYQGCMPIRQSCIQSLLFVSLRPMLCDFVSTHNMTSSSHPFTSLVASRHIMKPLQNIMRAWGLCWTAIAKEAALFASQALLVNEQRALANQEQASQLQRLEKRCSKLERALADMKSERSELQSQSSGMASLSSELAAAQSQVHGPELCLSFCALH